MPIRRTNPKKRLFPIALTECERGFLSYLSTSSGLPMGRVLRDLILRETIARHQAAMKPLVPTGWEPP